MPLTIDNLSVWELAHRLAGADPQKHYWPRLPLPVRDAIRLLMYEILAMHLESSLIMEKRRPDSDVPPQFYIRHHIDLIYACVEGKAFPKRLLQFIQVDRPAFRAWCEQSGHPLPEFWYSVNYRWPEDEDGETDTTDAPELALTPKQKEKQTCQKIASEIWQQSRDMPMAQVARQIYGDGTRWHVSEKTVTKWVREIAPASVRNRPGRPKK